MSNDSDLDSWSYWRDKKGIVEALQYQYPDLLKANPSLQMAVHNIRANEALIDKIMSDLADKEDSDE